MTTTRRLIGSAVVALALAAAGCTSGGDEDAAEAEGDTSTTTTTTAAPFVEDPTFVPGECWWDTSGMGAAIETTCGTVKVPADRSDADSTMISLPVARIHDVAADPSAAPVLLLHGGPGGSLLDSYPAATAAAPWLTERDAVLWDQRGSGRSEPSLNCPEKEIAAVEALGAADPFEDELEADLAAAQECHDRLVDAGIDLDDYDTPASVADIESIRQALGVEQWNLVGASYGTRLGLAYAREHADRVRTLTIDSVYPTQIGGAQRALDTPDDAFDRLIEACAEDPACDEAHPDLGATLERAVAELDERPDVLTSTVEVAGETSERTFELTGADLRSGMFAGMYDSELIPLIPGIISSIAEGDRSILPTYISMAMPRIVGLSEGAFFAIDCADSGRQLDGASSEEIAGQGETSLFSFISSQLHCETWDVEFVPESFEEPALPDVPTLVFAGTLDPITPYDDSVEQAEAMPNARFVGVPRGGHGVRSFDGCTTEAFLGFLADPEAPLPACTESIEPLPFA